MHVRIGTLIPCLLMISAGLLASPPGQAAAAMHASVRTSVADKQADAKPPECTDDYFRAFPGPVNYCWGSRHWAKGSYRLGIEFFKLAASWSDKEAQYSLGLIYYNGRHVPVDRALGIAWLELAAQRHDPQKEQVAKVAAQAATAQDRQRAQQLLAHMRLRYGDKVAAKRAWKHYLHELAYVSNQTLAPQGCVQREDSPECVPFYKRDKLMHDLAEKYFGKWQGTVTVGPIESSPAPAASSGR